MNKCICHSAGAPYDPAKCVACRQIDEQEKTILPFLQWLRKEYKLANEMMVETWDGETETYSSRMTEVTDTDEAILSLYRNKDLPPFPRSRWAS